MTTPDPTILTILLSGLAATGSAIGVLFKTLLSHVARIEERLKDCEADREKLHEDQANLWRAMATQAGVEVNQIKEQAK